MDLDRLFQESGITFDHRATILKLSIVAEVRLPGNELRLATMEYSHLLAERDLANTRYLYATQVLSLPFELRIYEGLRVEGEAVSRKMLWERYNLVERSFRLALPQHGLANADEVGQSASEVYGLLSKATYEHPMPECLELLHNGRLKTSHSSEPREISCRWSVPLDRLTHVLLKLDSILR